jgi:transposase
VINAIFYVLCTGCPWRWLPHDYPPHGTVYEYFRKWKKDGTWIKIHDYLRDWVRATEPERHPHARVLSQKRVDDKLRKLEP